MPSYAGKYTPAKIKNPLDRMMEEQSDNYGGYEKFSIGRTVNDKPRPQVQEHGHARNER